VIPVRNRPPLPSNKKPFVIRKGQKESSHKLRRKKKEAAKKFFFSRAHFLLYHCNEELCDERERYFAVKCNSLIDFKDERKRERERERERDSMRE
jgi:hypothetical protein